MSYTFVVADLPFVVTMPRAEDMVALMPSFKNFVAEGVAGEPIFTLRVHYGAMPARSEGKLVEVTDNDMGHTTLWQQGEGYCIEINMGDGPVHGLMTNGSFTVAESFVDTSDPYWGYVLCSQLRVLCSQAVLWHGGVALHASVVVNGGKGFLFMGKSGTGKSTHSRLWINHIPGTRLLNDDNPIVRMTDQGARVYGTPWSGKTPCYVNRNFPIGGIVRLKQAPENRFITCNEVEKFVTLLPGASAVRINLKIYNQLCDNITIFAAQLQVGRMNCLPDAAAAQLCYQTLTAQ